jgi:N-acetylneuraminic acid mutarotase
LTTATAAAVGNRLFVFGGGRWDPMAKTVVNHSTAYAYSVAARRWDTLPPLPYPVRGMTAAALDERHIFLAGGYRNDDIEFVTDAFIFDVETKVYAPTKALPYAAMVNLVKSGDWLYCLGGEDRKKHRTDAAFRIPWQDLLSAARSSRSPN